MSFLITCWCCWVLCVCGLMDSLLACSVVFQFKSSKKSNNGTDVNAGQIPQLLYRQVWFRFCLRIHTFPNVSLFCSRLSSSASVSLLTWGFTAVYHRLPSNDANAAKGKQQTSEPVHILKRSFARTVSVVRL